MTPEEVAQHCPERYEEYMDCWRTGRIPCICGLVKDLAQVRKERDQLKQALTNIRKKCFDESQWGRYIDKVLKNES